MQLPLPPPLQQSTGHWTAVKSYYPAAQKWLGLLSHNTPLGTSKLQRCMRSKITPVAAAAITKLHHEHSWVLRHPGTYLAMARAALMKHCAPAVGAAASVRPVMPGPCLLGTTAQWPVVAPERSTVRSFHSAASNKHC